MQWNRCKKKDRGHWGMLQIKTLFYRLRLWQIITSSFCLKAGVFFLRETGALHNMKHSSAYRMWLSGLGSTLQSCKQSLEVDARCVDLCSPSKSMELRNKTAAPPPFRFPDGARLMLGFAGFIYGLHSVTKQQSVALSLPPIIGLSCHPSAPAVSAE